MKKGIIVFFLFIPFVTFILSFSNISNPVAAENSNTVRLYGKDRYETSIEISKYGWPGKSEYAVLARGDDFPDALCAAPLAKKYDAPILLTEPKSLSQGVLEELKRLEVKNVIITGGYGAVSEDIEDALAAVGITVDRISGSDRYATSVEIARRLGIVNKVALTTGDNFPDALSVAAIAAKMGMPILLTQKNSIPEIVGGYLGNYSKISKTYVIGGIGVISDYVLMSVPGGVRIGGNNRYETNAGIMREFSSGFDFNKIFVAVADGPNGDEFADALSGSALAARFSSPVVLVYKTLPPSEDYVLRPFLSEGTRYTVLGGEAAVPEVVISSLKDTTKEKWAVNVRVSNPPRTLRSWQTKVVNIVTDPDDATITASSSNSNVAVVSVSGKQLSITFLYPGISVITVNAYKSGRAAGAASFMVSSPVHNIARDLYSDSIQEAVDKAFPGDMIYVSSGTYNEHISIKTNGIKITGENRDNTIIDAVQNGRSTRAGIKINGCSGIEIKNLTVMNAGINMTGEAGREPYGIFVSNSSNNLFDNLKIKSSGSYEIYFLDWCSSNTVQNCIIDGNISSKNGYCSLDGIFLCGSVESKGLYGVTNTMNKFTNNVISNVVYGISMTASSSNWILDNEIHAMDSLSWTDFPSTGIVMTNSSMNLVKGNLIDLSKNGIRLSSLSDISPYAYAGTPDNNIISDNRIISSLNGVKVVGIGNIIQNNDISGSSEGGIWITSGAKGSRILENIISDNKLGIMVENVSNDIRLNKFSGGELFIKNSTGATLDASKNWWGSAYGPQGKLSGYISYVPWALNEMCTEFSIEGN